MFSLPPAVKLETALRGKKQTVLLSILPSLLGSCLKLAEQCGPKALQTTS